VLAGGESRRFGGAKTEARIRGRTLVERAARTLAPACDEVVVGRPPDLPDLRPDRGPLGGLEAALARANDGGFDGVVVLACDLPVVDSAALLALVAAWRGTSEPRRALSVLDEPLQPLCGVWGSDVVGSVARAIDEERLSARSFVRDYAHAVLTPASTVSDRVGLLPGQLLHNVNHPEDLEPVGGLVLPPIVSVIGWKNSGKTTVAAALVAALVARGHDVAAAKHGHRFRLDTEGTDSWRLRHGAGARRVLLAGPDEMALMENWRAGEVSLGGLVRRYLRDADVVVAEGWKTDGWPAIEVRSPGATDGPLFVRDGPDADRCLAVVGEVEHAGGDVARSDVPERTVRVARDDSRLGETLAAVVEARLLPVMR
jgi:molybdopterin-guanine dinucleotide biosynthesis protein MobB